MIVGCRIQSIVKPVEQCRDYIHMVSWFGYWFRVLRSTTCVVHMAYVRTWSCQIRLSKGQRAHMTESTADSEHRVYSSRKKKRHTGPGSSFSWHIAYTRGPRSATGAIYTFYISLVCAPPIEESHIWQYYCAILMTAMGRRACASNNMALLSAYAISRLKRHGKSMQSQRKRLQVSIEMHTRIHQCIFIDTEERVHIVHSVMQIYYLYIGDASTTWPVPCAEHTIA